VTQSKNIFIRALAGIPHGVLKCAYDFKLADRQTKLHRVSLNLAELRTTEQRRKLLISIQQHRERDLAAAEEQIHLLETLLDVAHCTNTDVSGDEHVQRSAWHDEFIGLTVANEEVGNLQEAVQLQNSRGRTLPGDSNGSDDDESDGDRSDGDGSDSEGGDGDNVLSDVPSMEPPPSDDCDQYQ
jgi:hypothetical protein